MAMLEPITSFLTGEASSRLVTRLYEGVVSRWSKYRAGKFFVAFLQAVEEEVKAGKQSESLDELLDEVANNEAKADLLFRAYRQVAFARSKTIGPKVIGFMTARMILAGRAAGDEEECIFTAAENLSDEELREFSAYVRRKQELIPKLKGCEIPEIDLIDGGLWININQVTDDTNSVDALKAKVPLDLFEHIGRWGFQLERLGVIRQILTTRSWHYRADSELFIDQDGDAVETTWWLVFPSFILDFAHLVDRMAE
jgi:hypothetical protein